MASCNKYYIRDIKVTLFQGTAKILNYLETSKLNDHGLGILYSNYPSIESVYSAPIEIKCAFVLVFILSYTSITQDEIRTIYRNIKN